MRDYDSYRYKPRAPKNPATQLAKLRKKNPDIKPVVIDGVLAKSWWAKAWNRNLESYADYSNRIGRGKSYVKSGAVLDLTINAGEVRALVQGSRAKPYDVIVTIEPLNKHKWNEIITRCSRKISNLEELASGKFPQELMDLFTTRGDGLFPTPKEIRFGCSCPDWASMCKHVAAVLYGIGARFDEDTLLFFELREIDFTVLLKKSVEDKMSSMLKNAGNTTVRTLTDIDTFELFGV